MLVPWSSESLSLWPTTQSLLFLHSLVLDPVGTLPLDLFGYNICVGLITTGSLTGWLPACYSWVDSLAPLKFLIQTRPFLKKGNECVSADLQSQIECKLFQYSANLILAPVKTCWWPPPETLNHSYAYIVRARNWVKTNFEITWLVQNLWQCKLETGQLSENFQGQGLFKRKFFGL